MTDYACDKPCRYCTVTGKCPRKRISFPAEAEQAVRVMTRAWNPNDGSEDAHLKCGCTIPWPIIQWFGGLIHGQVWCNVHGYQPKITKADIEKARKAARRYAAQQSQGTLDDVPPF